MYLPKHFCVDEMASLAKYMRSASFATLVTSVDGSPYASHLPLYFDPDKGPYGTLYGHVARANEHWKFFDVNRPSLAIFTGINAYITPNWLQSTNAVPTWNYVAVHAYGRPLLIEEPDAVLALLHNLTQSYETEATGNWTIDRMDQRVLRGLLKGIVAFEIPIERIEGKRKMSQNKPLEVQKSAISGLRKMQDKGSTEVAEEMAAGIPDAP